MHREASVNKEKWLGVKWLAHIFHNVYIEKKSTVFNEHNFVVLRQQVNLVLIMHVESSVHEKKQKNGWVSIDWQTFFTMCTSKIQKHATVYVFVILGFYWKTWFVVIFIGFMAPLSKGFVVSQAFEQPATTNRKPGEKRKKKNKIWQHNADVQYFLFPRVGLNFTEKVG